MKASMTSMVDVALATKAQWKQIRRVIEDAGFKAAEIVRKKCPLDLGSAQVAIISGNQIQNAMIDAALAKVRELITTNKFAGEVVKSKYDYPPEYSPKPIADQVNALKAAFPDLNIDRTLEFIRDILPTWELPENTNWFAFPRWDKIGTTYGEAFRKVLEVLAAGRAFHNYRDGQLGGEYLKQASRTIAYLEKLAQGQTGDVLIVPAQFGRKHKGESVRRARETFQVNEFGLGAFAVGCMLLTHPDRAVRWEELDMDCSGDKFSPEADGVFSRAPLFDFNDGRLEFRASEAGNYSARYGSVSAFLPQSILEALGN